MRKEQPKTFTFPIPRSMRWNGEVTIKEMLVIFTVFVVAISLIIVAAWFALTRNNTTGVSESLTYKSIETVVTVDGVKPSSIIIAPASEKWWGVLQKFNASPEVGEVTYDQLGEGVTYLSYTVSNPGQYAYVDSYGVPTMLVVYDTTQHAVSAAESLPEGVNRFTKGNLLMFIPSGAFTDIDYNVKAYKDTKATIDETEAQLDGEAYWEINMKAYNHLYMDENMAKADKKVYTTILNDFGVTDETRWVGTSSDGFTWDGTITDLGEMKKTPTQIFGYLSDQVRMLKDGEIVDKPLNEIPVEEQTGVLAPRQSILSSYMIISTPDGTIGNITDFTTDKTVEGKKLEEGLFQVTINPNQWLSFVRTENVSRNLSKFDVATITVLDGAGNTRITLE